MFGLDLKSAHIVHTDDGASCLASVTAKLCSKHYASGLLLGSIEATCLTALLAVGTGRVSPGAALAAIRQSEAELGFSFAMASWDDVVKVGQDIAARLMCATVALIEQATEDMQANQQQTSLLH